jgi:hypothetical protein
MFFNLEVKEYKTKKIVFKTQFEDDLGFDSVMSSMDYIGYTINTILDKKFLSIPTNISVCVYDEEDRLLGKCIYLEEAECWDFKGNRLFKEIFKFVEKYRYFFRNKLIFISKEHLISIPNGLMKNKEFSNIFCSNSDFIKCQIFLLMFFRAHNDYNIDCKNVKIHKDLIKDILDYIFTGICRREYLYFIIKASEDENWVNEQISKGVITVIDNERLKYTFDKNEVSDTINEFINFNK